MSLNQPASSDYASVLNYVSDRRPVAASERAWVYWKHDMVTLKSNAERSWLDAGIERLLRSLHCKLVEVGE